MNWEGDLEGLKSDDLSKIDPFSCSAADSSEESSLDVIDVSESSEEESSDGESLA